MFKQNWPIFFLFFFIFRCFAPFNFYAFYVIQQHLFVRVVYFCALCASTHIAVMVFHLVQFKYFANLAEKLKKRDQIKFFFLRSFDKMSVCD